MAVFEIKVVKWMIFKPINISLVLNHLLNKYFYTSCNTSCIFGKRKKKCMLMADFDTFLKHFKIFLFVVKHFILCSNKENRTVDS